MSNATEYADSLAASIAADTENGHPFGLSEDGDGTPVEPWEWLSDVLDIQYTISSDKQYRSARVLIAFGGPTAWINTGTGMLEASWWSATECRELPESFIEALDNALEELYESL